MELLALLTTAKEAGFELGSILTLAAIYWRLDKKQDKRHGEVVQVLTGYKEETNKRIERIESHVGITKLKEI